MKMHQRFTVALAALAVALFAGAEGAEAALAVGALWFPVEPKTRKELAEEAEPEDVKGGQSEALPWVLFDTAEYVSGTTTQLTYFTAARATPRLSNLNGRGLPTPQYFEAYYFTLQPMVAPAVTAEADMWALLFGTGAAGTGAPTWSFTLADKQMGPFPLATLHGLGGMTGHSTATDAEFSNNADPSGAGTFCADGSIMIPPNQTFSINLDWPAAVTLAGNVDVQVAMHGVLHRRIL